MYSDVLDQIYILGSFNSLGQWFLPYILCLFHKNLPRLCQGRSLKKK